jgi:hypothetical protein
MKKITTVTYASQPEVNPPDKNVYGSNSFLCKSADKGIMGDIEDEEKLKNLLIHN